MWETVFDDRGPPGACWRLRCCVCVKKQGGISNDEAIFDVERSAARAGAERGGAGGDPDAGAGGDGFTERLEMIE